LCGEDGAHVLHKVIYGHQLRCFAGLKLKDNSSSIISCEEVDDTDIVEFNGQTITNA